MDSDAIKTMQWVVHGRVQGVFFRQSAKQQADALGLTGWVKNRPDGSVACSATGPESLLAEFEAWLRQGPPDAQVTEVEASLGDLEMGARFDVLR